MPGFFESGLCFPPHIRMTEEEQGQVVETVNVYLCERMMERGMCHA